MGAVIRVCLVGLMFLWSALLAGLIVWGIWS